MAIQQFARPQNKQEVRRFLGLCGFFRRFIPQYAKLAQPISGLLKDKITFFWTPLQEAAFHELKEKLMSKPLLQLYNPKAYTELHCDASCIGLSGMCGGSYARAIPSPPGRLNKKKKSGMLLQQGDDGRLLLVHAVYKKTTPAEKNYHSIKQELLAVV